MATLLLYIVYIIIHFVYINISNGNTIICNNNNECESQTIICNENENCNIECSATSSCQSSIINCPDNYECTITCSADSSCRHATFEASKSSKLTFTDCVSGSFTCTGITIYCPSYSSITNNKNCILNGDNSISGANNCGFFCYDDSDPIKIYAKYGWNDIDSTGYSGDYSYHSGIMYCTSVHLT